MGCDTFDGFYWKKKYYKMLENIGWWWVMINVESSVPVDCWFCWCSRKVIFGDKNCVSGLVSNIQGRIGDKKAVPIDSSATKLRYDLKVKHLCSMTRSEAPVIQEFPRVQTRSESPVIRVQSSDSDCTDSDSDHPPPADLRDILDSD